MADGATGITSIPSGSRAGAIVKEHESVWRLVAAFYFAEALAVAILVFAYRLEGKAGVGDFLTSRPGILCVGVGLALLTTLFFIVKQCRVEAKSGSKQWLLGLVMNIAVVSALLLVTEIVLRLAVVPNKLGENLGAKLLYPRQWERATASYQALLRKAETQPTYLVFDEMLGFTVGPSRRSEDGLYVSSVEGIRSGRVGESYQGVSSDCRIALVGDSYTFGEVVPYEDTWGYWLQRQLGSRCQVLNFGVGGYGVDQMYLRYLKDVRAWHPDLVILGFINHDVIRTMAIYTFLMFPDGGMPFAKPRFVLQDGELEILNRPLPSTPQMLAQASIRDLPFIEYDINYRETEWDRPDWRYANHSYVFRLLTSLHPLYEHERPQVSDRAMEEINRRIYEGFVKVVTKDGGLPVIVYLPTDTDYPIPSWEPIGLKILREAGIPHHDLRTCVGAAHAPAELFNLPERGGHYSPRGNRVVTDCLFQEVQALRDKLDSGP